MGNKRVFKKIYKMLLILFLLVATWCSFQYWRITSFAEQAKPQKADVMIVLGAAVWPNGPSPALSARINHAVAVYNQGFAEHLILTGGIGAHPPSEAEAMQEVMLRMGVDPSALYLEDQATRTRENIQYSKEIMDQQGWQTAIIVTDTFHLKRAMMLAQDAGMMVYGAPAKNSVLYRNDDLRRKYTLREVLAVTNYYIRKICQKVF